VTSPGSSSPRIPVVDLARRAAALEPELTDAVARVVRSGSYLFGPELTAFEADLAAYTGYRHAIGVSSGTDALRLSLVALGIGAGDEVIVPAFTAVPTAAAVCAAGATPVFADIDPDTATLDESSARAACTEHTRAVIPVHLMGATVDLDPILELAREHDLRVIEDTAQAHGADHKGRRVGSIGDIGCFSFYPTKNLGGWGDGGAVVTPHERVADRVQLLRSRISPVSSCVSGSTSTKRGVAPASTTASPVAWNV